MDRIRQTDQMGSLDVSPVPRNARPPSCWRLAYVYYICHVTKHLGCCMLHPSLRPLVSSTTLANDVNQVANDVEPKSTLQQRQPKYSYHFQVTRCSRLRRYPNR